jgi:hypothetical protein
MHGIVTPEHRAIMVSLSHRKSVFTGNLLHFFSAVKLCHFREDSSKVPTHSFSAVHATFGTVSWHIGALFLKYWQCLFRYNITLSIQAKSVECSYELCLSVFPTKKNHTDSDMEICEATIHVLFVVALKIMGH